MSMSYYIQVAVSCIILSIILYWALKFSKSMQKKRYSGEINIVDRISIDTGVTLILVHIHDKTLLLGVGNRNVKVLDTFKKE